MNLIKVRSPRWNKDKQRCVGIATFRIANLNKIEIEYRRKSDGQKSFPHLYFMSGADIKKYPKERIPYSTVEVHMVPMDDLEIFEDV